MQLSQKAADLGFSSAKPDSSSKGLNKKFLKQRSLLDYVSESPPRFTLIVFASVILIFTFLLSLPISQRQNQWTNFSDSFFTAVSAICVTGLTSVNTAQHWSEIGQIFILLAIQVGGLGIVTVGSILTLSISHRLGIATKKLAQGTLGTVSKLGEIGSLLKIILITTFGVELLVALTLFPQLLAQGSDILPAAGNSIFYGISSFNNAGFTPENEGLLPNENNMLFLTPLMISTFLGALGFPVLVVLMSKKWHAKRWNINTKLTLTVTFSLLIIGTILWGWLEWSNPKTIGGLSVGDKIFHALFASVMSRSGGFSLVDQADMSTTTRLLTDGLMFIGGGSVSTAGGIKVTTFALIFLAIVAEARGNKEMIAFKRSVPMTQLRIAISVVVLGIAIIFFGTGALLLLTDGSLDHVLFDTISGFGTVGLSVGLTQELNDAGLIIMSFLMFAGRVGSITFATALTLKKNTQIISYPEERIFIG